MCGQTSSKQTGIKSCTVPEKMKIRKVVSLIDMEFPRDGEETIIMEIPGGGGVQ